MKYRVFEIVFAVSMLTVAATMQVFASEKGEEWNPVVVQTQSDELLDAAHRLVRKCRASPPNYLGDVTSDTHIEFRYHVQHFRSVAADLAMAVEDGKGRAPTAPMYNELLDIVRDLKRYAVDNPRGAWSAVERAVMEVDKSLQALGVFYTN